MNEARIGVLITCHNRRAGTLACLDALAGQRLDDAAGLDAYLVDDGCTDGTVQAVERRHPWVTVVHGTGELYWCGGMRLAFAEAARGDYDYYLWLNDDTRLYPDAVWTMLTAARQVNRLHGREGIIVGPVCDPDTRQQTYGGVVRVSRWRPLAFAPVEPYGRPSRCDTFNGNCVLVPCAVARAVGNVSTEFTHWFGDTDYGLRAEKAGYRSWVAGQYVGTCRANPDGSSWADPRLPLRERIAIFRSPRGLPPREWIVFVKRHAGALWPYCWLKVQLRLLLPGPWAAVRESLVRTAARRAA
ncbi:MAG TPA: glycosyltransferase family 2 protein [Phycisphaerae bacterium]|nr:glycosyltransferase family 2 protein [Phycisphaerae bacterium]